VNGIPFIRHAEGIVTSVFDHCSGHIDMSNNMYHYREPPPPNTSFFLYRLKLIVDQQWEVVCVVCGVWHV
jgi:hypothetical protein